MAPKHIWTDEDAAFAAAQWASGVTQKEISRIFGSPNRSFVCNRIRAFIEKYNDVYQPWSWGSWGGIEQGGDRRKALVKRALASFVATREGQQ
jgi:hypothetical protein